MLQEATLLGEWTDDGAIWMGDVPATAFDVRVSDAICRDDRDWFRTNPHQSERHRLAIPGECPGLEALPNGWVWGVRVTYLSDESRNREFHPVQTGGKP